MANYLNLKGFTNVFDTTLNNELQDNLVEFLDWGLLEKGNYQNVTLGELAPNGQDYSLLKAVSSHISSGSGTVWEGFRQNWIWQSGVSFNPAPIVGSNNSIPGISGIYINNNFYSSSTSGNYKHKVDYFNGRVIFDNPIPSGSKIQAEYSYKYINVIYANSLPWIREIQYRTLDIPIHLNPANNTEIQLPAEARIQLPAIAVEVVPKRTLKGYQLGGGQFVETDILFHCLAEDEFTRNKLVDIVSLQNDKTIYMFNSNDIGASGDFPLDTMGVPVSGALRYPELIQKYHRKGGLRLKNSTVQGMELINSNFYAGIVRLTAETIETTI
jgi:hypothetical protein